MQQRVHAPQKGSQKSACANVSPWLSLLEAMGSFILLAEGSQIGIMKTCSEIRRENLLKVIEVAGSLQEVANRLDKSHAQISQIKTQAKHSKTGKPRVMGDDVARLIEDKFGLEVGWMDNDHASPSNSVPTIVPSSAGWPFDVSQARLSVLNREDWIQINTSMRTLVEARERDARTKRNGTAG